MPLIGNTRVLARVRAFIMSERFPHAIAIEGNAGTGRHTLAKYIATAAVCRGVNKPCGECIACRQVSIGSYPDVSVVSPKKKQLSVDEVRALKQDAFLKPSSGERKVYIIERAEDMQTPAQNALLKILEEPPAGVMFILVTTTAEKLLTTVRSRCITLSLTEPPSDEAVEHLKEMTNYSGEEIRSALDRSKNNIGLAKRFLAGEEKNSYRAVAKELIGMIRGRSEYDMLKRLRSFEKDRSAVAAIFDELCDCLGGLLRESCFTHVSEGLSREQIVALYEATVRLKATLPSNPSLMLLFANLCNEYKSVIEQ